MSLSPVISSFAFSIVSVPFSVFTVNCPVTSFPSASFTTAIPVTLDVYSPAFVPAALAVRPSTVYAFPSTVYVSVSNPLTSFGVPSYVSVLLFATTVISYFSSRSVIVSLPSVFVIS